MPDPVVLDEVPELPLATFTLFCAVVRQSPEGAVPNVTWAVQCLLCQVTGGVFVDLCFIHQLSCSSASKPRITEHLLNSGLRHLLTLGVVTSSASLCVSQVCPGVPMSRLTGDS